MVDFPFTMIVFGWVILLVTSVRMICKCPLIHDSAKNHVSWQLPPTAASVAAAAHIASFFLSCEHGVRNGEVVQRISWTKIHVFLLFGSTNFKPSEVLLGILGSNQVDHRKIQFSNRAKSWEVWEVLLLNNGGGNFSRSKSTWQNKKVPNAKGLTFSRLHVLPTLLNSKGQKGS